MSAIRVTELKNGLRVATDPMPSVETASVGVWVDTGSRCEPAAMSGASHFLEHMVFKGTRRRDARAIAEEIESVGGHLNAHTSREYTAFYAKVLKEDTALAIDVISDMLQDATFDNGELSREKTVILQEIMQSLDTPDDVIFDRFQETAFPDQPLGRPVLGSAQHIDGMNRDRLMGFMREHYGSPRMVVAAAGNVDHDTLVGLATKAFDRLPSSCDTTREPGLYRGGEWREAKDLEQVNLLVGFQSISFRDQNFHALSVLSTLLGGGMSSRLFQEAREKRGLVYSIYSYPAAYADTGVFGIYAGTGADEVEELLPLICDELRKISHTVGDSELARARAQLKSGILMSLESTSARCEQLARQIMVFDRPIPTSETVAKIDAVTPEKVQSVAQQVFASKPTIAALGPIDKVPGYDAIQTLLH